MLFRLPAPRARDVALGFMGRLSRLPFGPFLIDFLGHMRADPRLRKTFFDIDFPTAVGLGPWLDTHAVATGALSRFGVGFIEIGPVTIEGRVAARPVRRLQKDEALWIDDEPDSISLAECNRRLSKNSAIKVPLIVRLAAGDDEEIVHLIRELDTKARLITLTSLMTALDQHWSLERWSKHLDAVLTSLECGGLTPLWSDQASPITKRRQAAALQRDSNVATRQILLCVTADQDFETIAPLLDVALTRGVAGLIVDGSIKSRTEGRLIGVPAREQALRHLRRLRERYDVPIIASGGIHEPEHALEFLSSGASLVQVDTGLIYTGPGLAKENQRLPALRSNA